MRFSSACAQAAAGSASASRIVIVFMVPPSLDLQPDLGLLRLSLAQVAHLHAQFALQLGHALLDRGDVHARGPPPGDEYVAAPQPARLARPAGLDRRDLRAAPGLDLQLRADLVVDRPQREPR